jgi:transcriptional regulator with XRE-family HTH domain
MRPRRALERRRVPAYRSLGVRAVRGDEQLRQLGAQVGLGRLLADRREELKLTQREVAEAAGWSQGFYSQVERGTNSSNDLGAWIHVADALQLGRKRLLERVWETRLVLEFSLPPRGDRRRDSLLDIAVQQFGGEVQI